MAFDDHVRFRKAGVDVSTFEEDLIRDIRIALGLIAVALGLLTFMQDGRAGRESGFDRQNGFEHFPLDLDQLARLARDLI